MEYKPIVCVFPENIISHFDVSANDVSEEFAKMLRFTYNVEVCPWFYVTRLKNHEIHGII